MLEGSSCEGSISMCDVNRGWAWSCAFWTSCSGVGMKTEGDDGVCSIAKRTASRLDEVVASMALCRV
jgi:hypothetical protein